MRCILNGTPRELDPNLLARMVGPCPPPDYPTNGMGPARLGGGRWGQLLARLATACIPSALAGTFTSALFHDYLYGEGGDEERRRTADLNLGRNVATELAETGEHSGWRVLGGAFLCWLGVSTCGRGAFAYGGRRRALAGFLPLPGPGRGLRVLSALARAPVTLAQIAAKLAALAKQQATIQAKYAALAEQAAAAAAKPAPPPVADAPVPVLPKPKPPKPLVVRPPETVAVLGARNLFGPGGTPSDSDLGGCLGDLEDLLVQVRACRIAERIFRDGQLTRARTLEELGRISDRAQNGDAALLAIVSHGTLVAYPRDPLGQTNAAVMDVYDRPGDDGFLSGLLTAWDVADWAATLPSEFRLWLYGDCCHLLPQARSLAAMARPRALVGAPASWRPRWLEPPPGLAPPAGRALVGEATTIPLPNLRVVGVATCQTTQTAADARIGGKQRGPGTYYFLDEVRRRPTASVEQLVRAAGDRLAAAGFSQDPGAFGSPEHLAQPWVLS